MSGLIFLDDKSGDGEVRRLLEKADVDHEPYLLNFWTNQATKGKVLEGQAREMRACCSRWRVGMNDLSEICHLQDYRGHQEN
jgi:hypothetical protein